MRMLAHRNLSSNLSIGSHVRQGVCALQQDQIGCISGNQTATERCEQG